MWGLFFKNEYTLVELCLKATATFAIPAVPATLLSLSFLLLLRIGRSEIYVDCSNCALPYVLVYASKDVCS